ncbi:hypothetical protein V7654_05675 [Bacillus sp. JJ1609]|uniref:DUF6932 family protein n=1 Tax=Bacillus sp. JJ1609 TaxID=3122977 RepID=UPI0030009754
MTNNTISPIPAFVNKNLPPGIHLTTWEEFKARYGINYKRNLQLDGLERAIEEFKNAGSTKIFIDGSFVTEKKNPGDYDALYDLDEIDENKIDNRLVDASIPGREAQKRNYQGEFFPMYANATSPVGSRFIDFFQKDKKTKQPKGIIRIDLR